MRKLLKEKADESKKNQLIELKKISEDLLKLIGFEVSLEVVEDEENNSLNLKIDPKDGTGLLIGNRGRNLISLQTIISLIFQKNTGEWRRILIDIAGWRQKEKERLEQLALQTAERVRATGVAQPLYNLTSSQRRIIHTFLSKEKDIKTESIGEGDKRYLLVSSK